MLQEDFEINYCKNSDISLDEYYEYFITLPCKCDNDNCLQWACVNNDKVSIKNHIKLYTK